MVKASSGEDLYAQLDALPEHLVGEIIDGELVVSPRPGPKHTLASSRLGATLVGSIDRPGPGGWWILDEPELHLGADVLDPDLAGWRRERMPYLPNEGYFSLAPDWVCEILSPRTAVVDRKRKMPIYAREGVPHLWLVDPLLRSLEVYLRHEARWLLHAVHEGVEIVHAPPFEEVAIDLGFCWAPEEAPEPVEPAPKDPAP